MKRTGGDPERGLTGERPLTCDIDMTLIVELNDHRFDPKTILNALNSPAYPLGIRQRCCLPTEPIAGELLDVSSMDEALSLIAREAMFRHACGLGLEGIVSKRATSRYRSGRCDAWRKVKNRRTVPA